MSIMRRQVIRVEVCEYFYEYFNRPIKGLTERAWYDERRYITDMRPSMRKGNFYRLWLSDGNEVVVVETLLLSLERY
jgi:hypothetical protein